MEVRRRSTVGRTCLSTNLPSTRAISDHGKRSPWPFTNEDPRIQESSATKENDRPDHSPTKVQRLLTTTESDRPERLQLVKAKKTENQVNHDTNTDQEDQRVATIETDCAVRSQMTASESSALKILETLIFLLISLATVAVLF